MNILMEREIATITLLFGVVFRPRACLIIDKTIDILRNGVMVMMIIGTKASSVIKISAVRLVLYEVPSSPFVLVINSRSGVDAKVEGVKIKARLSISPIRYLRFRLIIKLLLLYIGLVALWV